MGSCCLKSGHITLTVKMTPQWTINKEQHTEFLNGIYHPKCQFTEES